MINTLFMELLKRLYNQTRSFQVARKAELDDIDGTNWPKL